MLTQTIMVNLTQSKLSAIIMRSEEKGRQIQFEIIDAAGEAVDLTEYAVKFIMLKPDDNIVMVDAVGGVVTQTEQMTTAKGAGYYCIRLLDDDTVVYSGQGKVLIDDHVVDDETLQSISEVDGLIFPDDFLTTDSTVALIDDTDTSADTTWSSNKISGEISASVTGLIDDNATDSDTTWSSYKINELISSTQNYSITEHIIGKWIDGSTLYAKTYDISVSNPPATYNTQLDVTGLNIVKIEKHYAEYLYNSVWYYLVGDSLTYNNSEYLHLQYYGEQKNIIDLTSHLGNVSEIRLCFTLIYTKQ